MFKVSFNCKTVAHVDELAVALSVADRLKEAAEVLAMAQPRGVYSVVVTEDVGGESRRVFRWLKRG